MRRGSRGWWLEILKELTRLLLTAPAYKYLREDSEITTERVQTAWHGFPGAAEEELERLEGRIGRRLPWSYRELLSATNGFIQLTSTIGRLLPAAEVDLYELRHPDIVRDLTKGWATSYLSSERYLDYDPKTGRSPIMDYHGDHLNDVVEITEENDEITVLLDPLIVNADGEWEAWYFGPGRIQGAFRYRTLPDLVEDRFHSMRGETWPRRCAE